MKKILIIQTAFIGDVVLATAIVEKWHEYYPESEIDFLLRKGNEYLLKDHPFLHSVLVWDKKGSKYRNLWKILNTIRTQKYDFVVNLQRFGASGLLTALSGAKITHGFSKNPFSAFFTKGFPHQIGKKGDLKYLHETDRNQLLIAEYTDQKNTLPKLYPSISDFETVSQYKSGPYITISPASVWFTKQFPKEKWVELIREIPKDFNIYLTGGTGDINLCEWIRDQCAEHKVRVLSGKLSFLQTAALMKNAVMNYTNDSAPMHFASAMNAPVTAVYCSTIPEFGFGPLSDVSRISQIEYNLECRPCGLHGFSSCPKGHYKCAFEISIKNPTE